MKIIGFYTQPGGIRTPYYNIRNNHAKAYNSHKELGLQVLVDYMRTGMWVNIKPEWLEGSVNIQDLYHVFMVCLDTGHGDCMECHAFRLVAQCPVNSEAGITQETTWEMLPGDLQQMATGKCIEYGSADCTQCDVYADPGQCVINRVGISSCEGILL